MGITTSKKNIFLSLMITITLSILVIYFKDAFIKETQYGLLLFVLSIICCLLIGVISSIDYKFKSRTENIISTILYFLLPIVSLTMVEALNGVFIYNFSYLSFFNSYILYLLFYGLFYALTGSYKLSVLFFNIIVFIFALVNHYVFKFKGTPFVPMDFSGINTAKEVISAYDFAPDYQIIIAIVLLFAIVILGFKLKTPRMHLSEKLISRIISGFAMLLVCLTFYFTDAFAKVGLEPDFWNQARGYKNSGFLLNFCLNTKYLYLNAPDNYNPQETEKLMDELNPEDNSNKTDTPNIICIMNESFSDLSVCGEFQTNVDCLSFYNSLTENTIKGNLYVPVHGAGTSNTEYEFLTGNSTSFYPAGSNAYMLYVKNNAPSLTSIVGNLGYSKDAFHPYYSTGWNRNEVYNIFGFDAFYSITSVIKPSILLEYINNGYNNEYLNELCDEFYPYENILLRQYVSDSYNYDKLISYYENRDKSKPYYMFNVTMQNHGGYQVTNSNFKEDVKLTSTKTNYPKTEQYLSLLKKSDEAFEELINYFKDVEEPTIICMFGDHQPQIEEEFYEEIMGTNELSNLSLEDRQKRFITPFIIWANFDIEEEYIDKLSVNYLSSYILKTAGIKMPKYNSYLLELSKEIPVINNNGYIGKNGVYYKNGEKSDYSYLIENYNKIQYNNAFDGENRKDSLFN